MSKENKTKKIELAIDKAFQKEKPVNNKENDSRRKIGIFGSVPVFALPKINSVNELKALVGISSYQGVNDEAFPSLEKLAERIGLSIPATSTAVSGLVRKDLVGRKRNYGKTNTYFLLYETESKEEIQAHNREEKKKSRAKRLMENIEIHNQKSQSFESLEHSKVSNHGHSNSSNIEHLKVSNDILKEHLKEQKKIPLSEISTSSFLQIKTRLESINKNLGFEYHESNKANEFIDKARKQFPKFDERLESTLEKLEYLSQQDLTVLKFPGTCLINPVTIQSLIGINCQLMDKIQGDYKRLESSSVRQYAYDNSGFN